MTSGANNLNAAPRHRATVHSEGVKKERNWNRGSNTTRADSHFLKKLMEKPQRRHSAAAHSEYKYCFDFPNITLTEEDRSLTTSASISDCITRMNQFEKKKKSFTVESYYLSYKLFPELRVQFNRRVGQSIHVKQQQAREEEAGGARCERRHATVRINSSKFTLCRCDRWRVEPRNFRRRSSNYACDIWNLFVFPSRALHFSEHPCSDKEGEPQLAKGEWRY